MNRIALSFIMVTFLFVLVGCKTTAQYYAKKGHREIYGEELRNLISNKRVTSDAWVGEYYADGKMKGDVLGRGISYDGTWKINDKGRLCISTHNRFADGCKEIFEKNGGGIIWTSIHTTTDVVVTPLP